MMTFVDISSIYPQKQMCALNSVSVLQATRHPNLLNLVAPVQVIDET